MNYDMLTVSAQNGGWMRYENFPVYRSGHRVNPVYRNGIKVITGFWHCIHCKLMGSENTMKEYTCSGG